jgi:hypothetical protein
VRLDSGGASDDHKLTGFRSFGPSDKVSDSIADRLAEGLTSNVAWGGRLFRLDVFTALALCKYSLTLIYLDVSMRRHRVK